MGDTADATAGPTAGLGEVPTLGARASLAKDAIILVVVALLSVLPYASGLGFYSDDWEYLALLQNAPDHSLIGLVRTQYAFKAHLRMRPTQIVTQALLFKAFGLKARGYHIVNALVLASLAVFFYLVLREVGTEGDVAFAASAIYILLPNYSTDRFWFAAFSYLISMTLFLVGLYALLKAAEGPRYWRWTTAGLLALLVAMSGLETVIPLTVSIPLGLWLKHQGRGMAELSGRIGTARAWLLLSAPLVAAAAVVHYKAATARTAAVPGAFYAVRLAVGSAAVNFGTYGVALPHTVGWALHHISRGGACLGAVIGTVVFLRIAREATLPRSGRFWRHLTAVGFAVFLLGTAIFLTTPRIEFWSLGAANRVWLAASAGMALILVGASGLLAQRIGPGRRGRLAFAAVVSALCVSGFVITSAVSTFWIAASRRQLQVLSDIQRSLPAVAPGTTVLIRDVCLYEGPAIVFESPWDLTGALRLVYGTPDVRADMTMGRFVLHDEGLSTRIYDTEVLHRYGPDLLLLSAGDAAPVTLTNKAEAQKRFDGQVKCPEGLPGRGTIALPFDTWFKAAENKGFRIWR